MIPWSGTPKGAQGMADGLVPGALLYPLPPISLFSKGLNDSLSLEEEECGGLPEEGASLVLTFGVGEGPEG